MAAPMIYAIMVAGSAALVTMSGYLSSLAALDTSRVMAGEFWRLLSGHLAHLTWRQYLVDAPAFIVLSTTYGKRTTQVSALLLSLFAALSVSLGVILAGSHQVYGGLSGLSCASVSALLLGMILEQPRQILPYLVGCLFGWYLLCAGGFASSVRVASEAHSAGALSGVVFVLMRRKASLISKAVKSRTL
jgi:hypothetical protein